MPISQSQKTELDELATRLTALTGAVTAGDPALEQQIIDLNVLLDSTQGQLAAANDATQAALAQFNAAQQALANAEQARTAAEENAAALAQANGELTLRVEQLTEANIAVAVERDGLGSQLDAAEGKIALAIGLAGNATYTDPERLTLIVETLGPQS